MQRYKNFFNQQTLIVPTPVDSNTKTTANNIEYDKILIKSETIWENIHNFATQMTIMSLGITANKEKNGALLAYIAKNIPDINLRKLLKMVYLIDEKFMELRGFPLTWFDYYAWAKGPVAPEVYEIKNGAFNQYVSCHKNEAGKNIVNSVLPSKYQVLKQMDVFSPYELGIIDDIMYKYGNMSADELSDLTHKEGSLWSQIVGQHTITFVDGKSDIEIPLQLLNGEDEEKNEIYEDAKWNMDFQAALNQHKAN